MGNIEESYSFHCPYCMSEITIQLDLSGGRIQEFVYDCEVCCHPIDIRVKTDEGKVVDFGAEAES